MNNPIRKRFSHRRTIPPRKHEKKNPSTQHNFCSFVVSNDTLPTKRKEIKKCTVHYLLYHSHMQWNLQHSYFIQYLQPSCINQGPSSFRCNLCSSSFRANTFVLLRLNTWYCLMQLQRVHFNNWSY